MDIDSLFDKVFWIIFLAVVGTFAWKIWKNGGFRGAMFGSSPDVSPVAHWMFVASQARACLAVSRP
jgi:hypothetical protein